MRQEDTRIYLQFHMMISFHMVREILGMRNAWDRITSV
jgi:hypothetical protein